MKRGIKYDFSLLALLLIPVGVSLSVVGYQLSTILKLPVFVDQIGIMLVSMIAGPWVGLVAGMLGNVVNGMLNPVSFGFAFVSMALGLVCGFMSRWRWFTNIFGIVIGCAIINVVTAMVSGVVSTFMFGGVTGSGTDLVTAAFLATGQALWTSVLSANLLTGTFNTIINFAVSYIIVKRIPDRFLVKLNYGMPYIKKKGVR
ncbi:ECF transporter S component [Mordavella massiliensis]|uniref:ECF transporter S component n=1 Tax=Mordavella massiliensis TaxID=1871024 RepID=A0A938XBY9_9CLOT|nr:ECF transporter S component [Mordavella massiliensis]MBM6949230.1 ECF transporter S component [Mordavella massiliensis]